MGGRNVKTKCEDNLLQSRDGREETRVLEHPWRTMGRDAEKCGQHLALISKLGKRAICRIHILRITQYISCLKLGR